MKVLFLSCCVEENTGGERRSLVFHHALNSMCQVDYVYIGELDRDKSRYIKRTYDPILVFPTNLNSPAQKILRFLKLVFNSRGTKIPLRTGRMDLIDFDEYDLIFSQGVQPALYFQIMESPDLIIDMDDYYLDTSKLEVLNDRKPRPIKMAYKTIQNRLYARLFSRARTLILSKYSDSKLRPNHVWIQNSVAIPEIPDAYRTDTKTILYVGNLRWAVNRRGLLSFLEEVWPRIRSEEPLVEISIVGVGCEDAFKEDLESFESVTVHRDVEELAPYYEVCSFTIAPTYFSGGTPVKVLESLAFQKACVTTEHVSACYDEYLTEEDGLLGFDSYESMARGCLELIKNPKAARGLGRSGRIAVQENFSQEMAEDKIKTLFNERLRSLRGAD